MILIIGNNFSNYILLDLLEEAGEKAKIINLSHSLMEDLNGLAPEALILALSNQDLEQSNICFNLLSKLGPRLPILGIGLGHLAIGNFYGAQIKPNSSVMHGKVSHIYHDGKGVYKNLPTPFPATRYDSFVIDKNSLPPHIQTTSCSEDGEVMGIRHLYYPIEGVQFHPESIMSYGGDKIIKNFLTLKNRGHQKPALLRFYK